MQFTVNHNEAFDGFEGIKDGTYEVFIEKAHEDATKNGAEFINFWLRIRNDIQQPSQNQIIFHRIWRSKQTQQYHAGMLNTLAKAAQLPNGKSYNSMDDLLSDFVRKPLVVTVKNEKSEYNGNVYENLNVKSQQQTKFTDVQHRTEESNNNNDPYAKQATPAPTVTDDDVPF